jgi:hypothetical protein
LYPKEMTLTSMTRLLRPARRGAAVSPRTLGGGHGGGVDEVVRLGAHGLKKRPLRRGWPPPQRQRPLRKGCLRRVSL